MSDLNTLTLDDITAAANEEYKHLTVPLDEHRSVVLVNALQLSKADRKRLGNIQSVIDEDPDGDIADMLEEAIRIAACDDQEGASLLIDRLGGNAAKLSVVVNRYSGVTQAGEA